MENEIKKVGRKLEYHSILDLRDKEDEDYKNYSSTEYNGSIYVSDDENPYKILFKANAGEYCEEFYLHPDTVGIANRAFQYEKNGKKYCSNINFLSLNSEFNCFIDFLIYCRVKILYLEGRSDAFLYKDLVTCACAEETYVDIICAPYYELGEFRYTEIKPVLTAGYILMKTNNYYIPENVISSYERYIKNRTKNLYMTALSYEFFLNYLLDNILIPYEDIHDILLLLDKDDIRTKMLEEYREKHFSVEYSLENNNKKDIVLPNETSNKEVFLGTPITQATEFRNGKNRRYNPQSNAQNYINFPCFTPDEIFNLGGPVFAPAYFDEVNTTIPLRKKYESFMRNSINIGDYYLACFLDEVLLLKVISQGNARDPYIEFSVEDITSLCAKNSLINIVQSNDRALINNNCCDSIIIGSLYTRNYFNAIDNKVKLYPELGLFKSTIIDGKAYSIPGFINSNDIIIDKKTRQCFDNYFVCPVDETIFNQVYPNQNLFNHEYIVFRKLNSINDFALHKTLDNSLLIDAIDLRCAYLTPFAIKKDVNYIYTNSSGKSYNYIDILRFLSRMTCVNDRSFTKRMIITYFSEFYQKQINDKELFLGFSSNELLEIVNDNFTENILLGYVYYYDTLKQVNNDLILYDKQWFSAFYNIIKMIDGKIEKCSDIIDESFKDTFYSKYTILPENIDFLVAMAKQCKYLDEFYNEIEKYLISKL